MITAILYSLFSWFLFSPSAAEPADRWLIELKSGNPACLEEWWSVQEMDRTAFVKKPLPVGNWWVVVVPARLSSSLKDQPCIAQIMEDQKIDWRKQPNDPAYINQGDMNLIGMPKAWDITTGGVTTLGDTIVVALVDDGFETTHPDLDGNIWINHLEIANDNLDNDNNGYIDDRIGYNVSTGNDDHEVKSHGTSVAGVIGAEGNNGIGVSGVSWKVKVMLISGADFESEVIEAYQYILDMRNLYTQTNGAKGAFVVATNLSGGINYAFAADHPIWCEMYDKLGEKGILSVAAAPNESISVDVSGDMPTTCTSPYLIAVTNVDLSDEIVGNAGYGAVSIDIGAPGEGTVTTASGGQYKAFPGTSAAAPHVAGAIGLIYSSTCPDLFYDLETDPANTAFRVKNLILETAKPNNSLNEITYSGKRLQVDAALKATVADCGMPEEPTINILSIRPNPSLDAQDVKVYFEATGDITGTYFELFDAIGAKVAEIPVDVIDVEQGYITLDGRGIFAGVYFVTLRHGDKKVVRKLVRVI
jgi:subtilisin family serine protease